MRAETLILLGAGAVLGIHTLAVGADCFRCLRAMDRLQRHAWRLKSLRHLSILDEASLPPLTVLLPVRNQADDVMELVRRMTALKYPSVEYLIIHDGSDDQTLRILQDQLGLHPVPRFPVAELHTQPVKGVYQSEDIPKLWVIDKESGGRADCFNAGLNFCQTPLVAMLAPELRAADNALIQASRPFLEHTHTWAVSGRIRPAPAGEPRALPPDRWGRIQTLLIQRNELLDAVLDTAGGCFSRLSPELSMFRRNSLVEAGGFAPSSPDPMADMAARLYRVARLEGDFMQLVFIPDTLGWRASAESREELKQAIETSQVRAKLLQRSGRLLPGRALIMLRSLWLPMLHLCALSCVLPLALLAPLTLLGWLPAVLAPASVWQLVLMLGERTDQRYRDQDLRALQRETWRFALIGLPLLSLWQLKAWFSAPVPVQPQLTKQADTSPLKSIAR